MHYRADPLPALNASYNSIIEITDYNTDHVCIGTAGNFK